MQLANSTTVQSNLNEQQIVGGVLQYICGWPDAASRFGPARGP